jgi:hypothetical protein
MMKNDIEISTIAIAIINFERLCLKGLITKINRRLSMAICLLLAIKFHEIYSIQKSKKILEILFDYYDKEWNLTKKSIIEAEFGVYVHLGFLLHIPYEHIYIVYHRLLKLVNRTNRNYLSDEMLEMFLKDIRSFERHHHHLHSAGGDGVGDGEDVIGENDGDGDGGSVVEGHEEDEEEEDDDRSEIEEMQRPSPHKRRRNRGGTKEGKEGGSVDANKGSANKSRHRHHHHRKNKDNSDNKDSASVGIAERDANEMTSLAH